MDCITLQKPTYFTGDITIYHVYLRFLRWSTKQPRLLALLGPTFAGGPGSSAAVGSGTEERVSWQLGTGLIHGTVWYGANLGFGWILGMAHGKFIHFHRFGGVWCDWIILNYPIFIHFLWRSRLKTNVFRLFPALSTGRSHRSWAVPKG